MARSRNIKPGFFTNDKLAELPALTRILFIALWTLADRAGRLEDRPKRIKAEALPYDEGDVESMLQALHDGGFIKRYQAGAVNCIQVVNWAKHQNPHCKEAASSIPAPDEHRACMVQAPDEASPLPERAGLIPDSGFLIPDSQEKQASPAQIPAGPAKTMSAKDRVWSLGPEIIGGAEAGARTLLGKLVKAHGEEIVDAALSACVLEQPGEPRAWVLKACQTKATLRGAERGKGADLSGDEKPAWAITAGFANRFEAENDGCFSHNASAFSNGKRKESK